MFVFLHPISRGCPTTLALLKNQKGRLAEGLGTGLQNLLLRFKSGSDLKKNRNPKSSCSFFCFSRTSCVIYKSNY